MFKLMRSVVLLLAFALIAAACSSAPPVDANATAVLSSSATREDAGSFADVAGDDGAGDDPTDDASNGSSNADEGNGEPTEVDRTPTLSTDAPQTSGADDTGTTSADAAETATSSEATDRIDAFEEDLEDASDEVDAAVALTNDLGDRIVGGVIGEAGTLQDGCVAPSHSGLTDAPTWVVDALEAAVRHPDFADLDVGVSVWIDGWGEVVTRDPDLPLVPASNEKILVAHAANELIDPSSTLDTTVELLGADLVLRAAGDPTFTTGRANELVAQVAAAGVTSAERLIIDVSDFPQPSAAPGWQSWQIRNFVGPLSGLMLDDNRWNTSDEFLESPALLNGEWFAGALRNAGIAIGTVEVGSARPGTIVGTSASAPVGTLVRDMMLFSDNQIADMMTLQLGLVEGQGTLEDGIAQIERELAELCVPLAGVMDDGSGLSRSNFRSAREFQEILRAIRDSDTADVFESQLPIGGVSGTLGRRFGGDAGRVQAKTGTIFGGRALSGYATTDSGRDAVFSIIINGERDATSASLGALDAFVRTILRS